MEHPDTLLYLDPPYWKAHGYGNPFPWSEYEAMAERVKETKCKAVLSINQHPQIETLFDPLFQNKKMVPIKYTTSKEGECKESGEVVYW